MNMRKHLSLYHKFVIVLMFVGLIPMGVLCTAIVNKMFQEYELSISSNYEQATTYVNLSFNEIIKTYDNTSKMMYFYDRNADQQTVLAYGNYDNVRQLLMQDEQSRTIDMRRFLQTIQGADDSITSVHFITQAEDGEKMDFHYNTVSNYYEDQQLFEEIMGYSELDRITRYITIIPPHIDSYYHGTNKKVFTIARNYFDMTKLGTKSDYTYIGTLFIDVDIERLERIYEQTDLSDENDIYILDTQNTCFYSTKFEMVGEQVDSASSKENANAERTVIESDFNDYGLKIRVVMETDQVFSRIRNLQRIIYIVLVLSLAVLAFGAIIFSKRLTKPIYCMIDKMSQIQTGNFHVQLPVTSNDEIGILSKSFNQMSKELERHINQVYVAQVKQAEAEMTSLKSQIYPHFLYNTLEVIRMTALDENDEKVSRMIEALSLQIHYIIGTVQDMAPLGKELELVEKYIYLLNCRIDGEIIFHSNLKKYSAILVPKLILQPIVENAYLHGIKHKESSGNISIDIEETGKQLIISVMDNGIGMKPESIAKIYKLLEGNELGIKNEYNWQSIGLKNVHDRIRYIYGSEFGLRIESSEMIGTIVSIVLPHTDKGEQL